MKIVDGRRGEKKATHSRGLNGQLPGLPRSLGALFAGQPRKRLSHIAKAGFVDGIRGRLGKSDAFHGISTVIDGRKWWHTLLPGCSEISVSIFGSHTHKVVEERSSSSGRCCLRWTEEVALLESQKYRQYAADCIRLAQTMAAADKQTLLEIA